MTEHSRDYIEGTRISYTGMLIQQEQIPWSQNLLAGIFSWLFLAASFMFPGSYLTSPYAAALNGAIRPVTRASFLILAAFCFGVGVSGHGYLWYRWRRNYVWISNKLFLPALINSATGLGNVLLTVYTTKSDVSSTVKIAGIIMTVSCTVIMSGLYLFYHNWLLVKVGKVSENL